MNFHQANKHLNTWSKNSSTESITKHHHRQWKLGCFTIIPRGPKGSDRHGVL